MIRTGFLGLLAVGILAGPSAAQPLGASTGGWVAVDQQLRLLGHHKRVLMIGAHPDDEDSQLLTVLVRGHGVEAAYLALTRGEGGQNLIGPELGPGLGVLRSGELLAARRLDGARQYFTRAFDFGYSKGLEDTWRQWPRDSVLKDVVRVVRSFRPQVIVSVFSGTTRDGHGQHQAAGWAARAAFDAAGDPGRFPELAEEGLVPWEPAKLYQAAWFNPDEATARLDGGRLDPAVGQSYLQIAMRGRSLHRSQDMGSLQRIGPSEAGATLMADRTGAGGAELFVGLDTTLASLVAPAQAAEARAIGQALGALRPWSLAPLARLRTRWAALIGPDPLPGARDQLERMDAALLAGSGMLCDAQSNAADLVAGTTARVTLSCWNPGPEPIEIRAAVRLQGRLVEPAWQVTALPGQLVSRELTVDLPADLPPTTPYYLGGPPLPGMSLYHWPDPLRSVPFEPAVLEAGFAVGSAGLVWREVEYRYNDQAVGELRRPVLVVPPVAVSIEPAVAILPIAGTARPSFRVTARLLGTAPVAGTLRLVGPSGWQAGPGQAIQLTPERPVRTVTLTLSPPAGAAAMRGRVQAVLETPDGVHPGQTVVRVEYSHVRLRQLVSPAEAELVVAPVGTDGIGRVGYLRGAADRIPEVLAGLGVDLVLLTADSLAGADLSRYDVVVIGPRAFETEPALAAWNSRLLDWVRDGGRLVVQYQQQAYYRGGHPPHPLSLTPSLEGPVPGRVSAARVAEEDAAVTVLVRDHPVFQRPNRLEPADWEGWVQERGLYFPRAWSADWEPLLAMADTGEDPLRGALLVSRVGRGRYVYTGLSFFRQLPAGVPGATRLFLNLLALRP